MFGARSSSASSKRRSWLRAGAGELGQESWLLLMIRCSVMIRKTAERISLAAAQAAPSPRQRAGGRAETAHRAWTQITSIYCIVMASLKLFPDPVEIPLLHPMAKLTFAHEHRHKTSISPLTHISSCSDCTKLFSKRSRFAETVNETAISVRFPPKRK